MVKWICSKIYIELALCARHHDGRSENKDENVRLRLQTLSSK